MSWHSTSHHLRDRREYLRRHATPAEAKLWTCLHNNRLGVRFRRQHSVGRFILDFYCVKLKLAIEVDGKIHDQTAIAAYDKERTSLLQTRDIMVIRFRNEEILQNIQSVVTYIENIVRELTALKEEYYKSLFPHAVGKAPARGGGRGLGGRGSKTGRKDAINTSSNTSPSDFSRLSQ